MNVLSPTKINEAAQSALRWIERNSITYSDDMRAIKCWHTSDKPYPEVTGYLIPTLLNYGKTDLAVRFTNYLLDVQNENGSWNGLDGYPRAFDTSAIVEGLIEYSRWKSDNGKVYNAAARGRDWIVTQCVDENGGLVSAPTQTSYPIYLARTAGIVDSDRYFDFINQWTNWSLGSRSERTHYIAYMLEGFINCGLETLAKDILDDMPRESFYPYQYDKGWIGSGLCYAATAQIAMLSAMVGNYDQHEEVLSSLIRMQNFSGGFGLKEESWVVKFFLDALWLTGEIEL